MDLKLSEEEVAALEKPTGRIRFWDTRSPSRRE